MEVDWVCKRAHLRTLLHQHPGWSVQQLADAVGCSKSMVCKWKKRLTHANPRDASMLFSRSRAAHHHPPRVSKDVIETIIEMRLSPPEQLNRTPGPKALLYYLPRDERLQRDGVRLPRSTRTIWQILDTIGLIERAAPVNHAPRPVQGLLEEVQMDFKEITTAVADPTSPSNKQHHLLEVCNAGRCWLFSSSFGSST